MYTDFYQLAMAQSYFLRGQKDDVAVFDYFYRKQPFYGAYAIFAGLEDFINALLNLRFGDDDILFLKKKGFDSQFLQYLKDFKFTGSILSSLEGDIVFPTRPILTVEAKIIEAQLIETLLLNILNFQTLIATKARRIRFAAGDKATLMDFGLRRAQGAGGYHASRAAMIGGFNATSNVRAGQDFGIHTSGTMAHSFVQSYEREIDAFRDFVSSWPEHSILLVDTYDTIKSGMVNAILVAQEMKERGQSLKGIRLDSGDLNQLSHQARSMLDEAGFHDVQIAASNQLDEFSIADLKSKGAPIDIFGVGTSLVTGQPDAALDGVYKLAYSNNKPRIKLSENLSKMTLPGQKQVYRLTDTNGHFAGADVIATTTEQSFGQLYKPFDTDTTVNIQVSQFMPVLHPVVQNGKRQISEKGLLAIKQYSDRQFDFLPATYKSLQKPDEYFVLISEQLRHQRNVLASQFKNELI